jgi:adenylate kinase
VTDVVLLGGPGAGKGTQAQILQREFGYRQISTGDLLREHRAKGTPLGRRAESFMQRGDLVPDDVIVEMVAGELPAAGNVLFDGFPRTIAQAQALDELLQSCGRGLPQAIYFMIERAVLEERLLGRWTNPRNGRVYHEKFNPPKVDRIDDEDGGPLVQREDDAPATVKRRLDVFEEQTVPLVAYYRNRGPSRFTAIDASQPIEAVTSALLAALHLNRVAS